MYKELVISTTNRQIADELLALKIPDATQNEIEKFGEPWEAVFYVGIQIASTVAIPIIAKWIKNVVNKPTNHQIKINDRPAPHTQIEIKTIIINQMQININKSPRDDKDSIDK